MAKEFITYAKALNGQKCVDAEILAEKLGVPKQVLCWTIENEPQLEYQKDYSRVGKQNAQNIGFKALIYALDKFCQDYNKKIEILSIYMNTADSPDELNYKERYEKLKFAYDKLISDIQNVLTNASSTHNESSVTPSVTEPVSDANTPTTEPETPKKQTHYKSNSKYLPELIEDEKAWQKEYTNLTKKTAAIANTTPTYIMKQVYAKMTKVYGIVFDQEKKDLRNKFNIDENEHISTLYTITVSPQLRSLYQAILKDLYNEILDGKGEDKTC